MVCLSVNEAVLHGLAHDYGYPVNTEYGGHGLGRTMYEDQHAPIGVVRAVASNSGRE